MTYSSAFFDEMIPESLSSAKIIVPLVIDLVRPTSVVDVGCATGAWLSVFQEHEVKSIMGLDGTYINTKDLLIPPDSYQSTDLARPFRLEKQYDLALSLEVAEHLPSSSARGLVHSLCQLAPVVLFSAAIPGQGGQHHVNEQWPDYWRQLFAAENFRMLDPFRPILWLNDKVASHYRQNMFLFVRNDVRRTRPELAGLSEVTNANSMMVVEHHIIFGFRATLKRLPYVAWVSLRRLMRRRISRAMQLNRSNRQAVKSLP
jgi:methyltransferase family protein